MLSAVSFYRVARWLHKRGIPVVPRLIDYAVRVGFACWVPHTAEVGEGVVFGYGGLGIVIHDNAIIGDRVHIDQSVTIGGSATKRGVPRIESDVYIGAGAKVLGPIVVGTNCVIGANAVVTRDIPAGSVAVGVPARVIRSGIKLDRYLCHRRTGE